MLMHFDCFSPVSAFSNSSHPKPRQHRSARLQSTKTTILHHLHHEATADSADSNKNMTFAVHPTRANLLSSSLDSGCRHVALLGLFHKQLTSFKMLPEIFAPAYCCANFGKQILSTPAASRRALAKSLGSRALLAVQFCDKIKLSAKLS